MKKIIRQRPVPAEMPNLGDELPEVLQRIYASRQVKDKDELGHGLDKLPAPERMKGLPEAVTLLAAAIKQQQRILIVGDFDADGATSSVLAVRALRMMGACDVDFLVPNRFEYGYGLTPEIVAVAAERKPDVIITVDNGIASLDGVAAAKARGMTVIVTDHHLPGAQLPAADAIVNPNQAGCEFPSRAMAGVGVIFYVMLGLRAQLREQAWFEAQGLAVPNLAELLDLVALGTVADVVPLDHVNRILVAQGLARIRSGRCCPGIAALLEVGGRQRERIVAADMGFVVGPRLNAAGRLEDMSIGINCLLTDSKTEALAIASQLDQLNRERRFIEQDMQEQALAHLHELHLDEGADLPFGLCLFNEDWHQGVIGILASRIKDRFHRPVIAFADAGAGMVKGSARSIPGFHMRDGLDAIATRHPGLVNKFGGHAMAAGLSLELLKLVEFQQAFDEEVRRQLDESDLQGVVWSDGSLRGRDLDLPLAEALRLGGPWGQAFPEPVFDGRFEVLSRRIVGEKHLKLQLASPDDGQAIDAIAFNTTDEEWSEGVSHVFAAYKLDINEFRGRRSAQLVVDYLQPCED